jgi:hypothetical protein
MEHKYAIFVLGNEIANAMKEVDYSSSSRISAGNGTVGETEIIL